MTSRHTNARATTSKINPSILRIPGIISLILVLSLVFGNVAAPSNATAAAPSVQPMNMTKAPSNATAPSNITAPSNATAAAAPSVQPMNMTKAPSNATAAQPNTIATTMKSHSTQHQHCLFNSVLICPKKT